MEINDVILVYCNLLYDFFSPLGSNFLLLAKEKQFVRQENARTNNTLEFKTKKYDRGKHETNC